MSLPIAPTIPAAEALLNEPWAHAQMMRLHARTVERMSERGFKVYAGPMLAVGRCTIGRRLRLSTTFSCADALVAVSTRWDLGAFISNVGAGRGVLSMHAPNELDDELADKELWYGVAIAPSDRTDNLLAVLQAYYEGVFERLVDAFEADLEQFIDSADVAMQV